MNLFRKFKRHLIYKLKKKIDIDNISKDFNASNLDEIFAYFGSDKAKVIQTGVREIDKKKNEITGHGYSNFYEKHLNIFKNNKVNILEIGSYSGSSAASFAKYFPQSNIYCLDINITNFNISSKNIKVFGLDVANTKMLDSFFKSINASNNFEFFDIIIDDGSHKLSDILKSINFFYKNLKPNGFYIIEDFKFPNYYKHLDDCKEIKIDELLSFISNKKVFKSNIINLEMVQYLIDRTNQIFSYKGLLSHSDIAFLKKN